MTPSSPRRRGAPRGNFNNFKHGFYTTRIKRRDLVTDEVTDLKTLFNDIALLRVFTHKLVESFDPSASTSEIADILRILCLSSAAITRILRTHYLITGSETALDPEIEAAINNIQARLISKEPLLVSPASTASDVSSITPAPQTPAD